MHIYYRSILLQTILQFIIIIKTYENSILSENLLVGSSVWWRPQMLKADMKEAIIEGFTQKISYSPTETVLFKVNCSSTLSTSSFKIFIYRLGYYSGKGARFVGIARFISERISQPDCKTEYWSRMVDCSNWLVSAEWIIPGDAVSGVYVALPSAVDTSSILRQYKTKQLSSHGLVGNYIPFVVRQNTSVLSSKILFKTSDLTWIAYNMFGGWNIYRGGGEFSFASRAKKASYNRPFFNRLPEPYGKQQNFVFGSEFPLIYWLEKYGYDVSYVSCADVEDMYSHGLLKKDRYRILLSVGHDEYWTPQLRAAHLAAREEGIHLVFLSGNEAFWRVLWSENYDIVNNLSQSKYSNKQSLIATKGKLFEHQDGDRRVFVCQKETIEGLPLSNSTTTTLKMWTGTFADPRHRPAEHQHSLNGQHFMVNAMRRDSLLLSRRDSRLRLWRDIAFSNIALNASTAETFTVYESPHGLLGYEWDASIDDCHRPNGMFTLSHTPIVIKESLVENYGASYKGSGIVSHKLSMYRYFPQPLSSPRSAINGANVEDYGLRLCNNASFVVFNQERNTQMELSNNESSLVFGAGTVQWTWALSSFRDGEPMKEDAVIQQATLNLLADMGVIPDKSAFNALESMNTPRQNVGDLRKLVLPTLNKDFEPPKSRISPSRKVLVVPLNGTLRVRGVSVDYGGGNVAGVEVSMNGGRTWHAAIGRENWYYVHKFSGPSPSLADTSDCGSFNSDGETPISQFRRVLVSRGLLYDDYVSYKWEGVPSNLPTPTVILSADDKLNQRSSVGSNSNKSRSKPLQLLILSRAVDDSGWQERSHVLTQEGLCDVYLTNSIKYDGSANRLKNLPSNMVNIQLSFSRN